MDCEEEKEMTRTLALTFLLAMPGKDQAAFRAVMCKPNWQATVSQRYDKRDDLDWIIRRVWRTQCY